MNTIEMGLRAILVSVDYAPLLRLTLPYNRHHFTDVMVVTAHRDAETQEVALANGCKFFATDAFYWDGADFNKWLALELALDAYGREGWLCLMDADVAWPKQIPNLDYQIGNLYTPLRHCCEEGPDEIPAEETWSQYRLHRNEGEWAGYSQIFHASDPHLPAAPWHAINWRHAGGADSFFQLRWGENRVRPPWTCLHIGKSGVNWTGMHGTQQERKQRVRAYVNSRQRREDGTIDYSGELL